MTLLSWAACAYLLGLAAGHYFGVGTVRRHNLEAASFIFVAAVMASVLVRRPLSPTRPTPNAIPSNLRYVAPLCLLAAIALYAPLVGAGLFADDYVLFDAARQGKWTVWSELFRPVLFAVWRAIDALSPDAPLALHLLNIILHGSNGTMTALLARRMGVPAGPAAAAGILFVVFPASVEPVAWPAGLQDVLMTSFVLGFVLLLVGAKLSNARAAAAVVLLLCACLTKESGVTAIALAALACLRARVPRQSWIVLAVATAAAGAFLALRIQLVPLPASYGGGVSRYAVKEMLARPFATLAVPLRTSETAAMPWLAVASIATIVVGTSLAATRWHRNSSRFHTAIVSAGFVLASIGAVNTLFYVDHDLLGSRYLYLGTVGWSILLATLLSELASRSTGLWVAVAITIVAIWVAAARAHVLLWRDAAQARESIVDAAAKSRPEPCADIAASGLPDARHGVPLFVNGFPEAMRERVPNVRFTTARPVSGRAGCHLIWTGKDFAVE